MKLEANVKCTLHIPKNSLYGCHMEICGSVKGLAHPVDSKEMSSLVRVKYCKPLTTLLYFVASSSVRAVPIPMTIFSAVERGVFTDLHLCIPAFCNTSTAYFSFLGK
jgi:hypothetical protein